MYQALNFKTLSELGFPGYLWGNRSTNNCNIFLLAKLYLRSYLSESKVLKTIKIYDQHNSCFYILSTLRYLDMKAIHSFSCNVVGHNHWLNNNQLWPIHHRIGSHQRMLQSIKFNELRCYLKLFIDPGEKRFTRRWICIENYSIKLFWIWIYDFQLIHNLRELRLKRSKIAGMPHKVRQTRRSRRTRFLPVNGQC